MMMMTTMMMMVTMITETKAGFSSRESLQRDSDVFFEQLYSPQNSRGTI